MPNITKLRMVLQVMLLFLTANICETTSMKTEVIITKTGKVQGFVEPSRLRGKMVQKFLNIPYAEPPVGKLRFSKPQPKKPWKGILNSSSEAVACWQVAKPGINLTEDCLILNVWTPYPQPVNATVMLWIHGGSFTSGRSAEYPGHSFVAVGEVILVTINYRLSALGFLSTGDHRIKGNFGLYDQRLAMKWVRENIVSFGGNPQSVTIFGLSAGAASVSAHTLSRQSWPYFSRAILQSGTMTMPWTVSPNAVTKLTLRTLLSNVNCKDDENLLKCLRDNVTETDLERMYTSQPFILRDTWFNPYVDGEFLVDTPSKLWHKGNVKKNEIIIGITRDENFYVHGQSILAKTRNIDLITEEFKKSLENELKKFSKDVLEQALKLYQPKDCVPSFIEAVKPVVALQSDKWFICGAKYEADLRSQLYKSTNIYLYQYSYPSPIPFYLYPEGTFGFAAHAIDRVPTFGLPIKNPKYPAEDQILSTRMILYWTNFAKTGDPNSGTRKLPVVINKVNTLPEWPRFTTSSKKYLDMESLSRMIVRQGLREKPCQFWKDPEAFTAAQQKTNAAGKHDIPSMALLITTLLLTVV